MINVIVPCNFNEDDLVAAALLEIFLEEKINLLNTIDELETNDAAENTICINVGGEFDSERTPRYFSDNIRKKACNLIIEKYGEAYIRKALLPWQSRTNNFDYYVKQALDKMQEAFRGSILSSTAMTGMGRMFCAREAYSVMLALVHGVLFDICYKSLMSTFDDTKDATYDYAVASQNGEAYYPDNIKYFVSFTKPDKVCDVTVLDPKYPIQAISGQDGCLSNEKFRGHAVFKNLDAADKCLRKSWEAVNGKSV